MPVKPRITFDRNGLLPTVVQDARSGAVLMVAYMNRQALARTLRTRQSHFWSRSRRQLWRKGAQSGHTQRVLSAALDCDRDTLLLQVEQTNGACHTGRYACFFRPMALPSGRVGRPSATPAGGWAPILDRIYDVVLDRKRRPKRGSYVSALLAGGRPQILKKVGEEAGELIIGSMKNRPGEIVAETADLWFHVLVLLGHHGIPPRQVYQELAKRFGRPPRRSRRPRRRR
jgi:phosphoribosyl-AMP cyclohydrolase / phosphoribosyl-ATP pyrophosphohydrolase